jgi:hypothetical protein
LLFILPFLLFFEAWVYFSQGGKPGGSSQLVAAYVIERLVLVLGAGRFGYMFPGLAVLAILLAWHLVAQHPWRFPYTVLGGMLIESLLWTLPLFVLNRVLHQALLAGAPLLENEWLQQVARCFGAGIYEELVFRLICITGLEILLVNLIRVPPAASHIITVLTSATLFAAQHHPPLGAEVFYMTDFLFRTGAGIYLAGLFLYRGFGIAAGCHMFYNVIIVTAGALQG